MHHEVRHNPSFTSDAHTEAVDRQEDQQGFLPANQKLEGSGSLRNTPSKGQGRVIEEGIQWPLKASVHGFTQAHVHTQTHMKRKKLYNF